MTKKEKKEKVNEMCKSIAYKVGGILNLSEKVNIYYLTEEEREILNLKDPFERGINKSEKIRRSNLLNTLKAEVEVWCEWLSGYNYKDQLIDVEEDEAIYWDWKISIGVKEGYVKVRWNKC